MNIKRSIVPLMVLFVLAMGITTASAQGWRKLGQKDVNFTTDHDTINASGKGKIREIHLTVKYSPVSIKRVVINYKDGTNQDLEFVEDLQVGRESRAITIEGDGHVINRIDLWYETNAMAGKKAKVTVYGRG